MKYIFVTGGVVSGLGKGLSAASLGRLLKARGLKVVMQKFDPYLNIDPGAMSPLQHGEVFVTADGAECDLDLGHYERFIDENLNIDSDVTTGKIYWDILNRERSGGYLGGTVQVIPHVTNEIKSCIYRAGEGADVLIVEIGGTVGDIESQPFLEAARQVAAEKGKENTMYIHLSLIVTTSGEQKSKPTQHSVKELLALGIQPDIIICRADEPIGRDVKEKIGLFCNIPPECVIQNRTAQSLYEIPLMLQEEGLDTQVCRILGLPESESNLTAWREMVQRILSCDREVTVALVGKYTALRDAYLSTVESLNHGGFAHGAKIDLRWVDAELLTADTVENHLSGADGIIVPGGFGSRGAEGMAAAARYARERKIPLLAIGLGMQMAAVEFTRAVCGQAEANSLEFGDSPHPVARPLPRAIPGDTSTMRRGAHTITIRPETMAKEIYGSESVVERHRHYHFICNREELEKAGLVVSGWDGDIPEILELPGHPFYLAAQFHPEFKSRPNHPHPLFAAFIGTCVKEKSSERGQ